MNFEQVHNFYERLVFEEIGRRLPHYAKFTADMLADVACVALNRMPPRYVRHEVDFMFYLTEHERDTMEVALAEAVEYAFTLVQQRSASRQVSSN